MGRLPGVEQGEAGLFVRIAYWFARRMLGRVPTPTKVVAHHPRLLRAVGHMELGQQAAGTVPAAVKSLVSLRVASRVGCRF